MASSTYTTLQYLLDRANISDTVTSMSAFLDRRDFNGLAEKVFAKDEVTIDYTQLWEKEVYRQAEIWRTMTHFLTSCQHIITGIMFDDLPQPEGDVPTPQKVKASANVLVTLRRDGIMGDSTVQSGSVYNVELIRVPGISGNPWRISYLQAQSTWSKGNMEVMKNPN
ncbi:hypothetical protein BJ138DRAFT_610733 [Hygrophoropsis aurantiaca]|uniref:Uncharacterized protein n=1 Tax=Hygrophoropsis aurantiaca TaxID=72124 RepID=A0ACB7ZZE2_9AGAM|nr:hypothetical protein BJ138DRAFT_610733 [Hygrophoropsis aurantiaca]